MPPQWWDYKHTLSLDISLGGNSDTQACKAYTGWAIPQPLATCTIETICINLFLLNIFIYRIENGTKHTYTHIPCWHGITGDFNVLLCCHEMRSWSHLCYDAPWPWAYIHLVPLWASCLLEGAWEPFYLRHSALCAAGKEAACSKQTSVMAGSKQVWLVGKEHGIWKKLAAFNLYKQTGRTEEGFWG